MRVLRTSGSDREDWIPRLCTSRGQPYAILSHRWADDPNHEVLFADIEEVDEVSFGYETHEYQETVKNTQYTGAHPRYKSGFKKIQGAARQALKDGYQFIWIDTCCIDKNSSAELSEAINSMWTWYKLSIVCYVYLTDVVDHVEAEFKMSLWWTRGWTLQELLAPQEVVFFTSGWQVIGPKKYMNRAISEITQISPNIVNGTIPLQSVSIAQRMCWASNRVTTRLEDTAYCLLGLFGVNMPLLYGEGENAFLRLQQEIIRDSDDESIFAWRDDTLDPDAGHGLLAVSPRAFAGSAKVDRYRDTGEMMPYTMTNKGLSILATIAYVSGSIYQMALNCPTPGDGNGRICIYVEEISQKTQQYARKSCSEWSSEVVTMSWPRKMIYVKGSYQKLAFPSHDYTRPGDLNLIQILPSEDPSTIKLSLQNGDVDSSKYSVVSYVDDPSVREFNEFEVLVDNTTIGVSEAVFLFLQAAQRSRQDKLFWTACICEPDTNVFENNSNLRRWQRIYASAQSCIIWLGVIGESQEASPFLPKSLSVPSSQSHHLVAASSRSYRLSTASSQPVQMLRGNSEPTGGQKHNHIERRKKYEETHATLLSIARHPYWRHAEIIPELVLANAPSIEYLTTSSRKQLRSLTRRDLQNLYISALQDIKTLHKSALGHVFDHGLPSIDTTDMRELLDLMPISHSNGSDDDMLLDRKQECRPLNLDFEQLLTAFRYKVASQPKDRVYFLLASSNLSQRFLFDRRLSSLEIFFRVADIMQKNLTLTILPQLVVALEILDMPTELPLYLPDGPDPVDLVFEIRHTAFSLDVKDVIDKGSRQETARVDRSLTETYSYCTLEAKSDVPGGLVFAKSQVGSTLGQQNLYTPRFIYLRQAPVKCSVLPVPIRFRDALAGTHALLEVEDNAAPHFMLTTDRKGLLALAFCMQRTPGTLPRICERFAK